MNDKDVSVLRKEELLAEKRERRKEYHTRSVPFSEVESLSRDGWIVDREFKTKVRLKKMKSGEELLANRIWLLFYNMGFNKLNIEKVLIEGLEVEVLCSDDETILFIFNKFSSKK
ncbi:hypothetical protein EFL25_13520, partial [Enterococcus faecium]|nr:hypothetical protein [Enterococcus faecium]